MELTPGIHVVHQMLGGNIHAFLVDDGSGLTLIDTLYDTDGHRVLDAIRGLGRQPADVERIVLTHGHRSHLGGLAALQKATGAAVYAHAWEADIIAGERKMQSRLRALIPMRPIRTHAKMYYLQIGMATGLGTHPPCPVDHVLADGDRIGPLHVLHTPGHSPGHLAFWWPERRTLLAGDAIATWPEFAAGWSAFNLNERQHRRSLARLAELDADILGVGHGEPMTEDVAARVRSLVASG